MDKLRLVEIRNACVPRDDLDEKVSYRVLYDILVQAGHVDNLHIPHDKETDRPKGYAFAEYQNEEITNYAVKRFSGLITLQTNTEVWGMC
ncbi:hypothetical protein LguiB_032115 [Lonicera macranthoides]